LRVSRFGRCRGLGGASFGLRETELGEWKLPVHTVGLPGKVISFYIVPLDPAYEAGLAGHVPVKMASLDFRKNPKTKFKDVKKMGKDEAQEEIEALREGIGYHRPLLCKKNRDGRATSSVSGATDYVVAGENPGNKLDEAKKQNLKIIDEKEFKKLIAE
jgi:hypothetical protein